MNWGIALIGLIMFLFGVMWALVLWVKKAIEYFKHCLMGHSSKTMEDSGAMSYLNCQGLA